LSGSQALKAGGLWWTMFEVNDIWYNYPIDQIGNLIMTPRTIRLLKLLFASMLLLIFVTKPVLFWIAVAIGIYKLVKSGAFQRIESDQY